MSISPCHVSRFSPEFQLACFCCRVSPSAEDWTTIRRLLGEVDVPAFVDLVVTRHRIGSLVHAVLSELPAEDLPAGLLGPLAHTARQNAVKALRAQRLHIMLARWFAEAGIDWLAFKGTTLAMRYYKDASTRQVNDLDIWVPAGNLPRARAVLSEHGFQTLDSDIRGDLAARGERHEAYITAYFHEEQHYSPELGTLELHWRLADNPFQFRLAPEFILMNADTLPVAGERVRVMNSIDLLLYLCEHGAGHGWARLKWLADLPRIIEAQGWAWPALLDRARQIGGYQSLILGLALCQDLFGWSPPSEVRNAIAVSRRLPIALPLIRQSWDSPAAVKSLTFSQVVSLMLRELTLSMLLASTPRSVVHQIRRYLLSPNDLRVMKVPDRWFTAYYAMRPMLILTRRARRSPKAVPP